MINYFGRTLNQYLNGTREMLFTDAQTIATYNAAPTMSELPDIIY